MRFSSLSEAIKFYAGSGERPPGIAPYGDVASQMSLVPQNIDFVKQDQPSVMIYGRSVWGQSRVIDIKEPTL